jgi:DNA recombination protein RmuC
VQFDSTRIVESLRQELRNSRTDAADHARAQRGELQASFTTLTSSVLTAQGEVRETLTEAGRQTRASLAELSRAFLTLGDNLRTGQAETTMLLNDSLESMSRRLAEMSEKGAEASARTRESLTTSLKERQEGNEKRLEQMRVTVDEKLQGTLEKRLGESFALVGERLEAVQRGLGEMQQLASGGGDLKKVLTNVSTRGAFGELQLRAILEQMLTPDQYVENFHARAETSERVEFAIVLPGRDYPTSTVHLPIDSKFPQEDYLRLVDASERSDVEAVSSARTSLMRQIRSYARDVSQKYVNVPVTTDFAVVFLPTEGLYAEVLRHADIVQELQRDHAITIVGPTTLAAFINSLRMGFRTLAIERRSSEVWEVLGAVKTEFRKFGDVVDRVKKQIATASRTLDDTSTRTRASAIRGRCRPSSRRSTA